MSQFTTGSDEVTNVRIVPTKFYYSFLFGLQAGV